MIFLPATNRCKFSISQRALPAHSDLRNGQVDPDCADVSRILICVQSRPRSARRLEQPVKVAAVVLLGEEGRLPIFAPLDEVLRNPTQNESCSARHGKRSRQTLKISPSTPVKRKSYSCTLPFFLGNTATAKRASITQPRRALPTTARKRFTSRFACASRLSQSFGGCPRSSIFWKTRYASSERS